MLKKNLQTKKKTKFQNNESLSNSSLISLK